MSTPFLWRAYRASILDGDLYEDVEADAKPRVMLEAMAVVAISAVAAGVGVSISGWRSIFVMVTTALLGWFVWAVLTYFIGAHLLPEKQTEVTLGQLLRTTGYSAAPGVLRAFGGFPVFGWFIFFLSNVWMFAAFVVAVGHALDYESRWRTMLVCLIGFVVYFALFLVFVDSLM